MSNMPGPLPSPTSVRRQAFMTLPSLYSFFSTHSWTTRSWFSSEKSSRPSSSVASSAITWAESSFQRFFTVFSSYSVGGMKKNEHSGHSSLTNDTRSFIIRTTSVTRSSDSSMPLLATMGAKSWAISSFDFFRIYSWLNQMPFW